MVSRAKWDPALHPRGAVGRFIPSSGSGRRAPATDAQRRSFEQSWSHPAAPAADLSIGQAYNSLAVDRSGPLAPSDLGAIREYQNASGFINGYLRNQGDVPLTEVAKEGTRQNIADLDRAVEKTRLVEDIAVYRGLADIEELGLRGNAGQQIHDRGFTSTSMDPAVARRFGNDLLEIHLPAGTHVALPSRDAGSGKHETEAELVVGRGAVYQITDVIRDEDDYGWTWRVRVELVGYLDD